MKLLALLVVLIIGLSSVAIAKSYCPANSLNRCNCPNGRYETYTNIKAVQEARKDPESCCYVDPKPKREPAVVVDPIPVLVETGELMASPPPAQEIVEPEPLVIQEAIVINDAIVIEEPIPPEDPIVPEVQEKPTREEYWSVILSLISCLTFYCG